nr:MAG TPA_asm: hypothetical protein [Bacteriophage sp.]
MTFYFQSFSHHIEYFNYITNKVHFDNSTILVFSILINLLLLSIWYL